MNGDAAHTQHYFSTHLHDIFFGKYEIDDQQEEVINKAMATSILSDYACKVIQHIIKPGEDRDVTTAIIPKALAATLRISQ